MLFLGVDLPNVHGQKYCLSTRGWRSRRSLRSLAASLTPWMLRLSPKSEMMDEEETHIFVTRRFLLRTYRGLIDVLNQRHFISIPYDECNKRRCYSNYTVPDPPGSFDGHVPETQEQHIRKRITNGGRAGGCGRRACGVRGWGGGFLSDRPGLVRHWSGAPMWLCSVATEP